MPLLDLAYDEDSRAYVDMNVFMTDAGRYVEIQGTAEAAPFDRRELDALLALAEGGIAGSSPCRMRRSTRRCPCMPVDAGLLALVQRVGAFHITERGMKRAQAPSKRRSREAT